MSAEFARARPLAHCLLKRGARPLFDIQRVIDLSLFLPGPLATQFMADHGAEVIKVESIHEGELNREIGAKRDGMSVYFANTHRGKKSLALNLKDPAGVEVLLRLAEKSDVLVEAFRPGVVDRLGIGYAQVTRRAPQIVYASIAAFGQSGPYRDLATHDLGTEAMTGVLSLNGGGDGRPAMPALANADMLASMMTLSGVQMALYRREETGKGDYLDMAMADCLLACLPNNMGTAMTQRRQPDLGQDPVREFLAATFRTKAKAEWIAWCKGRDVAFAPLRTLPEALEDARGWDHLGIPIAFRDEPGRVRFDAPGHGQHSSAILRGLGYAADDIAQLKSRGVIKDA
jgi:crotonobetainyl-CoA:carnitine CoA-transferase CaiB-like acyl-CoA transferase